MAVRMQVIETALKMSYKEQYSKRVVTRERLESGKVFVSLLL